MCGGWSATDARRIAQLAGRVDDLPDLLNAARRGEVALTTVELAARVITPANAEVVNDIVRTCTPNQAARVLNRYRGLASQQPANDQHTGDPADPHEPPRDTPETWWRTWTDHLGRGRIDAALSPLVAELLGSAFDAATQATLPPPATTPPPDPSRVRAVAQRCDLAAETMAGWALEGAKNTGVTRTGGEHFGVIVTVDLRTLMDALGIQHPLGTSFRLGSEAFTASGRHLDNSELRRAVETGSIRVLVESDGVPLWMGNEIRLANRFQRRALQHRSGGCCEIPGCPTTVFLRAHHVTFHEHGGPTSLDNLLLVCGFHHRELHRRRWTITTQGDQIFTIFDEHGRSLGTTTPVALHPNRKKRRTGLEPDTRFRKQSQPPPDTPTPPPHLTPDTPQAIGAGAPLDNWAFDEYLHALLAA